jgi:hypothetical protein
MRLLAILIAAAFVVAPEAGFAKDWRGYLVNSQCYDAEQRNINPFDTSPEVDRDRSDLTPSSAHVILRHPKL